MTPRRQPDAAPAPLDGSATSGGLSEAGNDDDRDALMLLLTAVARTRRAIATAASLRRTDNRL